MKLIVGLGNPGEKYKNNRHNVGFMVIDALTSKVNGGRWSVSRKFHCSLYTVHRTLVLVKPATFMNSSGKSVRKLVNHFRLDLPNIWVIHDDLDIALGDYKIQKGKGPRLHKGVLSIEEELGEDDFWRVRVGVENRTSDKRTPGEKYVVQNFEEDELDTINKVADKIIKNLINRLTNQPIN